MWVICGFMVIPLTIDLENVPRLFIYLFYEPCNVFFYRLLLKE
jgi:hypothetical protein